MSFTDDTRELFARLADCLFCELIGDESLNLTLTGEDQTYLRFNGPCIRQASHVEQRELGLQFQSLGRTVSLQVDLSSDFAVDSAVLRALIERARGEVKVLPEDPFLVPMANHGASDNRHTGRIPAVTDLVEAVAENAASTDFAGFVAAGPQIRATRNSLGQDHWFSTESFFVDFSLFTVAESGENKAVKGLVANRDFSAQSLAASFSDCRRRLAQLRRPSRAVAPGAYRVYFAPAAVADVTDILSWGAVSYGAWRRGNCALKKLVEGEQELSPQFDLRENFQLGLTPAFNSLGEIGPSQMPIVTAGKLASLLISSRSASEYGVAGNGAEPEGWGGEHLRSPEIGPGDLAESEALQALDTGIYVSNLHYLNWSDIQSARITGMTRYACFWVEKGEIVAPIQDLRFDESLYRIFGSELERLTRETYVNVSTDTYDRRSLGGSKTPGALISSFRFTL